MARLGPRGAAALLLAASLAGNAAAQSAAERVGGAIDRTAGKVGSAIDRTGAFIGRQLGADGTGAQPSRRASTSPALVEESPPLATTAAARAAAAARLREGLARLEATPSPTPAEREAAAAIIVDAAERGDPDAQYLVGAGDLLLPAGERDDTRAARWLARAAVQGHARAQYALARAYIAGTGVARDPAWANLWLARAARRDHAPAQHALALRQLAGEGGPADRAEAYRWLVIASRAGHVESERYRDALATRLGADERARLDADAAAFVAVQGAERWPDPPLLLWLQRTLAARGYDPGPVDGAYGPRTRDALRRFAGGDGALTPPVVARLRAS